RGMPHADTAHVHDHQQPREHQVDDAADDPVGERDAAEDDAREQPLHDAEVDQVDEGAGADPHGEGGGGDHRRDALRHHDRQRDDADGDGGADAVHAGEQQGDDGADDHGGDHRAVARELGGGTDNGFGD